MHLRQRFKMYGEEQDKTLKLPIISQPAGRCLRGGSMRQHDLPGLSIQWDVGGHRAGLPHPGRRGLVRGAQLSGRERGRLHLALDTGHPPPTVAPVLPIRLEQKTLYICIRNEGALIFCCMPTEIEQLT